MCILLTKKLAACRKLALLLFGYYNHMYNFFNMLLVLKVLFGSE